MSQVLKSLPIRDTLLGIVTGLLYNVYLPGITWTDHFSEVLANAVWILATAFAIDLPSYASLPLVETSLPVVHTFQSAV